MISPDTFSNTSTPSPQNASALKYGFLSFLAVHCASITAQAYPYNSSNTSLPGSAIVQGNGGRTDGVVLDYNIPVTNWPTSLQLLSVQGGDGGRAKATVLIGNPKEASGGGGALITASFAIDPTAANALRPGGEIRLILGNEGEEEVRAGWAFGAGGGGTGVLYRAPESGASWTLLALAGGGGGAAACSEFLQVFGQDGQDAQTGTAGGAGITDPGTNGGGANSFTYRAGGGGGWTSQGGNSCGGGKGQYSGGNGGVGNDSGKDGGFGCGGGGAGWRSGDGNGGGGGGGGYSGGGAGDFDLSDSDSYYIRGGGGGSYVNSIATTSSITSRNSTGSNGSVFLQALPVPGTSLDGPTITLTGGSTVTIYDYESYSEPGYAAVDFYGNSITATWFTTLQEGVAGTYFVRYSATDQFGKTSTLDRTVNVVTAHKPTFSITGNISVSGNYGAYSKANFAGNFKSNDSGQSLQYYTLTNNNTALFSVQPALSNSGTLTLTPATDSYGTATVSVVATDNPSDPVNGSSNPVTFTITVYASNPPSFSLQDSASARRDAGAQSIAGFASNFNSNDTGQTLVRYDVTNDSNSLFSVQPAISNSGTLTFTPQGTNFGSTTVTVTAYDTGTNNNTSQKTFTLTVMDAPPVASFAVNKTMQLPGKTLQFTDTSSSATGWAWDFDNDGNIDSTEQNPVYAYTTSGTYTVSLTVSNTEGSSTATQHNLVRIVPFGIVNADFSSTAFANGTGSASSLGTGWYGKFGDDGTQAAPDWSTGLTAGTPGFLTQVRNSGSATRFGQFFASNLSGNNWALRFDLGGSGSFNHVRLYAGTLASNPSGIVLDDDFGPPESGLVDANGWTLLVAESSVSFNGTVTLNIDQDLSQFDVMAIQFRSTVSNVGTTFDNFAFVPTGIPTLENISTLTGATEDTAFTITYATLAAAADEADENGDEISFLVEEVSSGILTKDGNPVTPGATLLGSGESLVWTPAPNAIGTLAAFTVKAHDGTSASETAVQVNVSVSAVPEPAEWTGSAGSGFWGVATNWFDLSVPLSSDTVYFTGNAPHSVTLDADRSVGSLNFSGDSAYSLASGTPDTSSLTLGTGGLITTATPASGSLTHIISAPVSLEAGTSASISPDAALKLSGATTGLGTFTKSGTGTLILAGNTAMAGVTTVSEGVLQIGDSTANSFSGDIVSNATVTFKHSATTEYSGVISGSGSVYQSGPSNLRLTGQNSYTGITRVDSGATLTLVADNPAATGNTVVEYGATLQLQSANSLGNTGVTNSQLFLKDGSTLQLRGDAPVTFNGTHNVASLNNATVTLDVGSLAGTGSNHTLSTSLSAATNLGNSVTVNVTGSDGYSLATNTFQFITGGSNNLVLNPTTATLFLGGFQNQYGSAVSISSTLTLSGTASGNMVTGVIANQGAGSSGTGSVSVVKNGSSSWELAGANTYTGNTTVNEGTLTLSGARTGSSGVISVGTAGFDATLNIANGSFVMGTKAMNIGNSSSTPVTATVNQSGGTISFTGGNGLLLGQNSVGNKGVYNLVAGSLTTFASTTRGVMLGVNSNSASNPGAGGGTFNLSGTGSLNMTAASGASGDGILQIGRSDLVASNTTNAFNQTGGTASVGILAMGGAASSGSTGIVASLNLTGGIFSANQFTLLSAASGNTCVISIGGNADVTLPAFPTVRGAGATATLYFDGGTLKPLSSSGAYLGGLTNAFIKSGGAAFDTRGFDITVSQDLLTDTVSTGGGLTKSGEGTLTLAGVNTYTGNTTVSAGTLSLSNMGLADSSTVSLASGAVLNLDFTGMDTVGKLYLGGVLQTAGTWGGLNSSATNKSARFTGDGILLVTSGSAFDTWASSAGLTSEDALPSADPDNDGIENTIEYALGLSPTSNEGRSRLPQGYVSASVLAFSYIRPTSIPSGAGFAVEKLSELGGTWSAATAGIDYTESTTDNGDGTTTVTTTSSLPLDSGVKQFLRLAITVN